jgi:hypothetical protein
MLTKNTPVIPGRAKREPGIHFSTSVRGLMDSGTPRNDGVS